MKFVDELIVEVAAGKGGDGMIAFRREKFVPMGGPSGGDGGKGGDVVLLPSRDLNTLYELSFKRFYKGKPGGKGMAKDMFGAAGNDCVVKLPVGTLVYDDETGDLLLDLDKENQPQVIARGGRGGKGNARFVSSIRRAPRIAEKGEPGEVRRLRLELKLLADIGLVGLPNAGKSTFLRAVSNARPKVADYPFTTLVPSLGIVKPEGMPAFCMADLPGLIEGAHLGAGLGIQFLKHIERTKVLLHLVDLTEIDPDAPLAGFQTIMEELEAFDPRLLDRPQLVAGNKMDLPEARDRWPRFAKALKKKKIKAFPVSGATREGVDELLSRICEELAKVRPAAIDRPAGRVYEYLPPFVIDRKGESTWVVTGREIERLVNMTDFTSDDGVGLFKKKLIKMGFMDELSRMQVPSDDTVRIGEMEFYAREFFP